MLIISKIVIFSTKYLHFALVDHAKLESVVEDAG